MDAQWGIDNLTKLCDEDPVCQENLDIPGLVEVALALFDDGPLPFRYSDPAEPAQAGRRTRKNPAVVADRGV